MNGHAVRVGAIALGAALWVGMLSAFAEEPDTPPSNEAPPPNPPSEQVTDNGTSSVTPDGGVEATEPSFVPELFPGEGIRISRMVLARGVERTPKDRTPIEPGTTFEMDGRKVYVFLEVDNPSETPGVLSVGWAPPENGREIGRVPVDVKAAKTWRTWAYNKYILKAGVWHAVVRNQKGDIIARAPFEMIAPKIDAPVKSPAVTAAHQ